LAADSSSNCIAITLSDFIRDPSSDSSGAVIYAKIDPGVGGTDSDALYLELYEMNGYTQAAGSFDLSQSPDDNYSTCNHCLRLGQDIVSGTADKVFFQQSGTMVLDVSSSPMTGFVKGSLKNVTLVESTIDADTYVSTPVAGGLCYTIASASFDFSGWDTNVCSADYYYDGQYCDCGCGAWDPDCDDTSLPIENCDSGQSCVKPNGVCQ
jgi:hypothetical protein